MLSKAQKEEIQRQVEANFSSKMMRDSYAVDDDYGKHIVSDRYAKSSALDPSTGEPRYVAALWGFYSKEEVIKVMTERLFADFSGVVYQ
jgi:hypothetical protein